MELDANRKAMHCYLAMCISSSLFTSPSDSSLQYSARLLSTVGLNSFPFVAETLLLTNIPADSIGNRPVAYSLYWLSYHVFPCLLLITAVSNHMTSGRHILITQYMPQGPRHALRCSKYCCSSLQLRTFPCSFSTIDASDIHFGGTRFESRLGHNLDANAETHGSATPSQAPSKSSYITNPCSWYNVVQQCYDKSNLTNSFFRS